VPRASGAERTPFNRSDFLRRDGVRENYAFRAQIEQAPPPAVFCLFGYVATPGISSRFVAQSGGRSDGDSAGKPADGCMIYYPRRQPAARPGEWFAARQASRRDCSGLR